MMLMSAEEHYYKLDNMVQTSSQFLRKIFECRWKKETGENWLNSELDEKHFIKGIGKLAYTKAGKLQKGMLESGCLDSWDISTLSSVLQNFGNATENKLENDAIQALTQLRNYLAHHPTKKLTTDLYQQKVAAFKNCLQKFHVEEHQIDKIVQEAGITSSVVALKSARKQVKEAETLVRLGEFEKAMECYDVATTMPSLLPKHMGTMFEKRAKFYINQAHYNQQNRDSSNADKYCELALIDATTALELNDSSWKAHYLIGQCHKWKKDFDKAILHYNHSLAISPIQKHVKNEVDACKYKAAAAFRKDNIDPRNSPVNLKERVAQVNVTSSFEKTEEQFLFERGPFCGEVMKGQDDVFRGHQYHEGWNVPQNDKKAGECYAKAAEAGNPEGIYNLGLYYATGKGMPLDMSKAYEHFLRAANMSPDMLGMVTAAKKNLGVACAQHAVGLFYEHGIVVEKDYSDAVNWYTMAAENGSGNSANNLGLLYMKGHGVLKNMKKGEMYFNQAVILKDPNAAESLMQYYITHLEPAKAEAMFKTGKALGQVRLQEISDEDFKRIARSIFSKRKGLEQGVLAFENQYGLDVKGLTFLERYQRQTSYRDWNTEKFMRVLSTLFNIKNAGGTINNSEPFNEELFVKAEEGSVVASRVLKTQMVSTQLSLLLRTTQNFSSEEMKNVLELAYECCTLELHANLIPPHLVSKLKGVIRHLFVSRRERNETNDDMKIRLCYVSINLRSCMGTRDSFGFDILKQGLQLYPDNFHYYEQISKVCGFQKDFISGLHYAELGLAKFPNEVELLYTKALFLTALITQTNEETREKAIDAYTAFLSHATKEHRKVPESYYALALLCIPDMSSSVPVDFTYKTIPAVKKLTHYYKLGKTSESNMLSCYLPYKKSGVQSIVEFIVQNFYKFCESNTTIQKGAKKGESEAVEKKQCLANSGRPQYLADPERKQLILQHRRKFEQWKKVKEMFDVTPEAITPKMRQTTPTKMSGMTAITMKEMNPTTDFIYENKMIDLTIIEDPFLGMSSIHLVAEDENGDVTRLYIYNVDQNKKAEKNLGFGCKIAILNPYLRIGSHDETNGLRNDDPNCLIYLGKVKSMCRFCGVEKAVKSCGRCKRVNYCSKQCQEQDWKKMKHKLICSKL